MKKGDNRRGIRTSKHPGNIERNGQYQLNVSGGESLDELLLLLLLKMVTYSGMHAKSVRVKKRSVFEETSFLWKKKKKYRKLAQVTNSCSPMNPSITWRVQT